MPVHIGPASEQLKRVQQRQLQQTVELDDADPAAQTGGGHVEITDELDATGTDEPSITASPLRLVLPLLWVVSMVVLTGCALVVLLVLLLREPVGTVGEGPSLDEVMQPH